MKLPKTLVVGHSLLKKSRLVTRKVNDEEALSYFQSILNEAQPKTPEDHILHHFVRGLYNKNKNRFLKFIKDSEFEYLVLWTESLAIVNFLGLRGVVYIKWTGKDTLYSVSEFHSVTDGRNEDDQTIYEHPLVRRQRKQKEKDHTQDSDTMKNTNTPDSDNSNEHLVDEVPEDDKLLVPDMLKLTRTSSVAAGTPTTWGDMV